MLYDRKVKKNSFVIKWLTLVFPSTLIFYPFGRHLTGRVSFRWEIMWDNGWRWNISLQKFTEQMSEIVTKIFSILFEQRKTLWEEIFLEALTIFWPKTILERSGVWNLHFRFEGEDVKTVTEGISKFINDVSLEKIELHFQRWSKSGDLWLRKTVHELRWTKFILREWSVKKKIFLHHLSSYSRFVFQTNFVCFQSGLMLSRIFLNQK